MAENEYEQHGQQVKKTKCILTFPPKKNARISFVMAFPAIELNRIWVRGFDFELSAKCTLLNAACVFRNYKNNA